MIRFCAFVAAMVLTGVAAEAAPDYSYDTSIPLAAVYGAATSPAPGVTARSISFASPTGHTITGEVISGTANAPMPAILFVHWLAEARNANHTEFEADAVALAKKGATSLLVNAMWARPNWFDHIGVDSKADYDESVAQVVDLRRALDALQALPHVDAARIAYVGHDFGAMFGALLAGVDKRPTTYVLMAGTATMAEWYLLEHKAKDEASYRAAIAPLDITGSLKQSKALACLFQFSAHDDYIKEDRALAFAAAAPLPKGIFWYDTDHALAVPAAFADRQAWLVEKLFGE